MFLDEDDEYYDDDDEYYDDDAEEEEGGSGALVVVLVALIVVLGVGALGAGAWLLFGDSGDAGPVAGAPPTDAPPVAGSTPAPLDTGMDDLPELDDPVALAGPDDPTAVAPSEEPAEDPTPEAVRSHYRDPEPNSERRLTVGGSSSSRSDGSSSRRSSGSRSGSSSRRTSGSSGSRSAAGSGTGRSSGGASSSAGSRRSSRSAQPTTTPEPASSEDTPEEGAVIEDEPRQARDLELRYEEDVLASLKTKAVAGSLSDDQRDFLEAVPDDNPLFTEVLAIAMRDAEAKRDWKGHCSMTNRIIKKLENRYQPEWNLELAKCRLRNADYEGAVDAIDRTLSDSMGMTRSTKVRRLMLAYEIKAVARTRIYDNQARANSGMGDDALLNNAISSWTEYRDYAAGMGDGRATQKADREIADLTARKGN